MLKKLVLFVFFVSSVNSVAEPLASSWTQTQLSEKKLFTTRLICGATPSVGSFQNCFFSVNSKMNEHKKNKSSQVSLLKNASISIDGGMQAHHHGLPTTPVISWSESDSKYKIEGLKFSMSGEWFLNFYIHVNHENSNKNSANKDHSNKNLSSNSETIKDKVSFKFKIN